MKCRSVRLHRASSVDDVVADTRRRPAARARSSPAGRAWCRSSPCGWPGPSVLVDVNQIPGLSTVECTGDGAVQVGALVRHGLLAEQAEHPLLAEAARWIGHTAIRTRGTAGGSLAHADPSAELPVGRRRDRGDGARRGLGLRPGPSAAARPVHRRPHHRARRRRDDHRDPVPGAGTVGIRRVHPPTRRLRPGRRRGRGDRRRRAHHAGRRRTGSGAAPSRGSWSLSEGGSAREAAAAAAADLTPAADLHGSAPFRRAIAAEMVRRALAQAGIG